MYDIYSEYVQLCKKKCISHKDMVNPIIRAKHNSAMKKLHYLEMVMSKKDDRCASVVLRLLENEDERVQISAAAYCIQAQILVELGIATLARVKETSKSSYNRGCASRCLEYCKPYTS